jgi:hypothetical protein
MIRSRGKCSCEKQGEDTRQSHHEAYEEHEAEIRRVRDEILNVFLTVEVFTASLRNNEVAIRTVHQKNQTILFNFPMHGTYRHSSYAGTVNVIIFLLSFVSFVFFSERSERVVK